MGGLAVVFTGVHLAGLVADSYIDFGVRELLVPFASGWQPGAVALGVVGVYLLVAIEVTSLLMKRLPRRFWRGVHFSSYALFVLATGHLLFAGTDASERLPPVVGTRRVRAGWLPHRRPGSSACVTPRSPATRTQPVVPPAPGAGSTVRTSTYTESSGDADSGADDHRVAVEVAGIDRVVVCSRCTCRRDSRHFTVQRSAPGVSST